MLTTVGNLLLHPLLSPFSSSSLLSPLPGVLLYFSTGIHEFKKQLPKPSGREKPHSYDPIGPVASSIADEVHLLCFDEFQVWAISPSHIFSFIMLFDWLEGCWHCRCHDTKEIVYCTLWGRRGCCGNLQPPTRWWLQYLSENHSPSILLLSFLSLSRLVQTWSATGKLCSLHWSIEGTTDRPMLFLLLWRQLNPLQHHCSVLQLNAEVDYRQAILASAGSVYIT